MLRVTIRLVADAALVAILLFLSAGTFAWWRAWVLLAVLFLIRALGALAVYRVSPDLMRERAALPVHKEQSRADRLLLLGVLATGFLGLPIIAGLDAFRWHVLPRPASPVAGMGLVLFALGWSVKSVALRANAFAVAVVRLQSERAHAVADSGPYGVVRHPFYAADPLILVGLGLWLQSYVAALSAVLPIALMVMRLRLEERLLRRELPGYTAYAARVRFRLIPGIW
jgi:protein-S-isoprenylcysteine O-methyltransferase Ste14